MKLSIIIPVFNEERTIIQVLHRVLGVEIAGIEKEIVIVDDGSKDKTVENIEAFLKKEKPRNTFLIRHTKNAGKGAAVRSGIQKATGDYIIIQDADLEYNPSYFVALLKPIQKGKADIVYGTRLQKLPLRTDKNRPGYFWFHFFGNRFLSLITTVLYGKWVTDMETCYKVFPRKSVKDLELRAHGFELEPELTAKLFKLPLAFTEVPITTTPRSYEEGKKLLAWKEGPIAIWTLLKYRFVK